MDISFFFYAPLKTWTYQKEHSLSLRPQVFHERQSSDLKELQLNKHTNRLQ